MTANACACGQPAPDATICGACEASLCDALDQVTDWLADAIDEAVARQVVFVDVTGRSSLIPLPFDERAARAAWKLRNTLSGWVRVLAETAPQRAVGYAETRNGTPGHTGIPQSASGRSGATEGYPSDTAPAMAAWLGQHMGRLRQHEAAAEAVDEITDAVRDARRTIDRPPGRAYAGPCGQCGRHLYVRPGKPAVTCAEHEPPWTAQVDERREWMLGQIADQLSHAAGAVHLLSLLGVRVSAVQVTRWVQDGRLVAHGTDQHRRALYRLGDLTVLAVTMRRAG